MTLTETLIRRTRSVCPTCLRPVPARVVAEGGRAYLRKSCPTHGESACLLSHHAWYHGGLDDYFFKVMPRAFPQRDYLVRLTEKCNLRCPICLASASGPNEPPSAPDLSATRLCAFLEQHRARRLKIDFISAEPTLRRDLPELVATVKRRGHIVAVHTNGIKLADLAYCRRLKRSGVDEIHLQMDGFDDAAYQKIRGAKLTANKQKVLANLERVGMATDLVMVIWPGVNEAEIPAVLAYCREHPFVRELFFLGTRALGYFRDSADLLMPDEVIDRVSDRSPGLVQRRDVFRFQKLYFALLALLGVRKCLYVQHYLLVRDADRGWIPAADLMDWVRAERVLDDLPAAQRRGRPAMALWLLRMAAVLADRRLLRHLPDLLLMTARLKWGWNLAGLPRRMLLLGFITACDPENLDDAVAQWCGKGELSADGGETDISAHANIERERRWRINGTATR